MRVLRWALAAGLSVLLAAALYQTLLGLDLLHHRTGGQVKAVAGGDQEVALIEPATNTDDWERLVAAVKYLRQDWPWLFPEEPALHVALDGAFPRLTADVPELALWRAGHDDA